MCLHSINTKLQDTCLIRKKNGELVPHSQWEQGKEKEGLYCGNSYEIHVPPTVEITGGKQWADKCCSPYTAKYLNQVKRITLSNLLDQAPKTM